MARYDAKERTFCAAAYGSSCDPSRSVLASLKEPQGILCDTKYLILCIGLLCTSGRTELGGIDLYARMNAQMLSCDRV
jgi:hypothetical protein